MFNRKLFKEKLQGKKEWWKNFDLQSEAQIDQLSDAQLEQRLTPKNLGLLNLKKEDLLL